MDVVAATDSFEVFRDRLLELVNAMHLDAITEPDEDWPGILFVQTEHGIVIAALVPLSGLTEEDKQYLGCVHLPERARAEQASRFGWVFPFVSHGAAAGGGAGGEGLALVVGDLRRQEAFVGTITRYPDRPPKLDNWRWAPQVRSETFVTPLIEALAEVAATRILGGKARRRTHRDRDSG
jgi:hypothetical protein